MQEDEEKDGNEDEPSEENLYEMAEKEFWEMVNSEKKKQSETFREIEKSATEKVRYRAAKVRRKA